MPPRGRKKLGDEKAAELLQFLADVPSCSATRVDETQHRGRVLDAARTAGGIARFPVRCRIDTPTELEYFKHGGVLNYVLRSLAKPDA